jgi:hypothetical protein
MVGSDSSSHHIVGRATVRRVGRWRYPVTVLTQDGNALLQMGRTGWLKIYLGRGQRVELADGDLWKIRAVGARGSMVPTIFDSAGRRIAIAGSSQGAYGINGRDFAYVLCPGEKLRLGRANNWILRHFEEEDASVILALCRREVLRVRIHLLRGRPRTERRRAFRSGSQLRSRRGSNATSF